MKRHKNILFRFLKGSKRFFGCSIIFVLLLVLFDLVNPKIIGYTIDFVLGDDKQIPAFLMRFVDYIGGREYALSHLWIFAGIVIGVSLVGALCRFLFRVFNSMGAEKLVKNMHDQLYAHITKLPFRWQDENQTGDIIQRCTSDVDTIKDFISEQLTNLFRMLVMIVLALFFMFQLSGYMSLIAVIFIPIVVGYSLVFHKNIQSSFAHADEEEGNLSAIAQENLAGVRVVRAFGREKYERTRFEKKNEYYTGLWVKTMKILSRFWIINDAIAAIETVAVLATGAYFTVNGQMTAGNYVAFLAYNTLLIFPVKQLGRVISQLSRASISLERICYIMNAEPEKDSEDAVDYPGTGDIEFEHVTFEYEDGKQVLDDFSMKIHKGETVGILGGTGSGKSTVINLLDMFYELPEASGRITLNGVDIRQIKKSELRRHIGVVLQEPYLFSRSIKDNINIAAEDGSMEKVEKAAETASLTTAIARFAKGYDTFVGERGVTLSGGQKQRTAIAQMLIRGTDIMIFDDSLSAVDSQTDMKIRQGIKEVSKDATVILISHRITTLMQADQIFVMDDGKVVEHGTHDELVELNGKYKKIFDLQLSWREEQE